MKSAYCSVFSAGVLHTSVVLLTEMCERSPDMLSHFRKVCRKRSCLDLQQSPLKLLMHHISHSETKALLSVADSVEMRL